MRKCMNGISVLDSIAETRTSTPIPCAQKLLKASKEVHAKKNPWSGLQRRARHALAHDELLQMGSYGTHGAVSSKKLHIRHWCGPVRTSFRVNRLQKASFVFRLCRIFEDLRVQSAPGGCSAKIIMVEKNKSVIKCLGLLMRHARPVGVKFTMALSRIPLSDSNFKFSTPRRTSVVVSGPVMHPTRGSDLWMRKSQTLFTVILDRPSGNWARGNSVWSAQGGFCTRS